MSVMSIFLCIFLTFNLFMPRKVKAVAPVGAAISSEAILTFVGFACVAGGAYLYENVDSEDVKMIAQELIDTGKVAKDFAVKINSEGKRVLTLTVNGVKDLSYYFKRIINDKLFPHYEKLSYDGSASSESLFCIVSFDDMLSFAKRNCTVIDQLALYRTITFNLYENHPYNVLPYYKFSNGALGSGGLFYDYDLKSLSIYTRYNGETSGKKSYSYIIFKHSYDGEQTQYTVSKISSYEDFRLYISPRDDSTISEDFGSEVGVSLKGDALLSMDSDAIDSVLPSDVDSSTYVPTIELPISPKEIDPNPDNPNEKPKVFYVPSIDFPYETTIEDIPEIQPNFPYTIPTIDPSTLEVTNPSDSEEAVDSPNVSYIVDPNTNDFTTSDTNETVDPGTIISPAPDTGGETGPDTGGETGPDSGDKTDPDSGDLSVPDGDVPTLDFEPLKVVTRKFPFSIPWDLWDCFKVFEGSSEPLKYTFDEITYNADGTSIIVIPEFTIDFSEYPKIVILVTLFKYLLLLCFIVMLIRNTRTHFIRG